MQETVRKESKYRKAIGASLVFLYIFLQFTPYTSEGQQVNVIKMQGLDSLLNQDDDTTYVLNFWATWCKPCVEELPHFLKTEEESAGLKRKFIYISLDFKRQLNTAVIPFLQKRNINSSVVLLDETDYDSWINKVDSTWQGNIPVTLIYNGKSDKRIFIPKETDYEGLNSVLKEFD